jgi:hypothetical protein
MKRRRWFVAFTIVVVLVAGLRLAVTRTYVGGYRVVDDYNLALQVIGANPTWRSITVQTETPSDVTIGMSEMNLGLGPRFIDERIAYVIVTLTDPLGTRRVVDSSNGVGITRLLP